MKNVKNKTTSTPKHNFFRIQISNIGVNIIKMCEKNQELSKTDQRKWVCAESNSQGRSLPILKSANSILQYIGSDGSSPLKNLVLNTLTEVDVKTNVCRVKQVCFLSQWAIDNS